MSPQIWKVSTLATFRSGTSISRCQTGWYIDLAGNLNRHFGVVFEAGGNYKSIS